MVGTETGYFPGQGAHADKCKGPGGGCGTLRREREPQTKEYILG